ncbi:MAG: hypothetical protein ABS36_06810 [Acidobacteria bacterium SCN 69-37]|nr:MAG: hypothetical protein ABS36_06810 [Acidobacteria bacterium SCN 69-37]
MLVVGGLAVAAPVMMGVAAAAAAAGLLLYWFGRCRHGGRLGLLPPTTNADGSRTPARWYCDQCGRSWPAGLDEHDSAPVVRFSGYDPSKLPAAARRAAMLEKQRQALAVKRAGLGAARAEAPAAASATVTSITRRRVAG